MHLHATLPSFEEVRIRPQEARSRGSVCGVGMRFRPHASAALPSFDGYDRRKLILGRHALPSACFYLRLKRFDRRKLCSVRMHSYAALSFEEVRIRPQETRWRRVGLWGRHALPSACICTQLYLRLKRFGYDRRKLIREGSVCGAGMRFRPHASARNSTFV